MRVQANQVEMKLNGTYQILVYADDDNIRAEVYVQQRKTQKLVQRVDKKS